MTVAPTPAPIPVPVLPTSWTPTTVITFLGAVALFVIGVLTSAGVTVPTGLSTQVQVVVGSLTTIAGAATALIAFLSKNSVKKAAIAAGHPLEAVKKL